MATPEEQLEAFIAAWRAGDAPDAGEWIDRADPADQDELADLIGGFLLVAEDVEPNAEARARIEADPLLASLVAIADTGPPPVDPAPQPWGERLRALRERAGMGLEALASGFVGRFEIDGAAERARRYLDDLETGALDARRVSSRAAFALEELLGAGAGALTPPAAPALFRSHPAAEPPAGDASTGSDLGSGEPAGSAPGGPEGSTTADHPASGGPPPPDDEDDVADLLRLAADALARPREESWDELDELLRGG